MQLTYSPSEPEYLAIHLHTVYQHLTRHGWYVYYKPFYPIWNGSQVHYHCHYGYDLDIDYGTITMSETDLRKMPLYIAPTKWQKVKQYLFRWFH